MALEDRLVICTDLSPEEALKIFLDKAEIQVNLTQNEHGYIIADTPLWIGYAHSTPEYIKPDFREALGMTPTVDIDFRLNKSVWMAAEEEILLATLKIIESFSWDVALFDGFSVTILVRKDSQLVLSANEYSWKPEILRLISMPYELKVLPIL